MFLSNKVKSNNNFAASHIIRILPFQCDIEPSANNYDMPACHTPLGEI